MEGRSVSDFDSRDRALCVPRDGDVVGVALHRWTMSRSRTLQESATVLESRLVLAPFFRHLGNQQLPCVSPSFDHLPFFHHCLDDNNGVPLISTSEQIHTLCHLPSQLCTLLCCHSPKLRSLNSTIAAFVEAVSELASLHHAIDSGKVAMRSSPPSGHCASGRSQQKRVDFCSIYIDRISRSGEISSQHKHHFPTLH
jgi:hypothetical protein